MSTVSLSLGSNCRPQFYINNALTALAEHFGELQISSVFESEAIGFDGDNFLNLVVVIDTQLSLAQLAQQLKAIEDDNDRDRSGPKFSGRTLDIDILTYDDLHGEFSGIRLPRNEVLSNAFVLWPLAQLLPGKTHPEAGKTYAQLWQEYDKSRQRLWVIDFEWNGRKVSSSTDASAQD
ncbi:MAG: 2-amino-4-hydroxy-6-hydroxymethyldihydropteridine diphosphokinase [Pseudohongiellaceae bacterium]|nr:2-amino-4-hydroxy-6-hydroxymethyldihydropteridine diphosphokinase [Pseudohongiellaceae bacterium]